MAKIVINEISQNYTYNIGDNSFAAVALPITACWGPAYEKTKTKGGKYEFKSESREKSAFTRFPANKDGLEAFVATFRGPAANYRLAKDYSYQLAMTLLTAGYDVLACRVCPGDKASGAFGKGSDTYKDISTGNKPDDWGTSWDSYYTDNYVKVLVEPSDWADTHTSYYIKTSAGKYVANSEASWQTASAAGIYKKETGYAHNTEKVWTKAKENALYERTFSAKLHVTAKYPGTFGNNLRVRLVKSSTQAYNPETGEYFNYWNLITYIIDSSGVQTSAENLIFVFDLNNSIDGIPHVSEVTSAFLDLEVEGMLKDTDNIIPVDGDEGTSTGDDIRLYGGADRDTNPGEDVASIMQEVTNLAATRFGFAYDTEGAAKSNQYTTAVTARTAKLTKDRDTGTAEIYLYKEWCYTAAYEVLDLLKDKLSYNPQAIILPGWDDQDIADMQGEEMTDPMTAISPLHVKLMEVSYYSRCACAHIDIPKSCLRKYVYADDTNTTGYAQLLARWKPTNSGYDVNTSLYSTHSALFAPWRQFTYVGMSKQVMAPPSFLSLLIHRAQLLNQPLQYFWALPTNRKQNLKIGKAQYPTPGKILNEWQKIEGVGVNVITEIPDVGTTVWGNSTLFEVPPATYQALANLSTRYLVNAVEDVSYRCGVSITFQYNNEQAYNKFYTGVVPTLDTMRNVGAIEDYHVEMAADIDGLDPVNANTVIGKIYLVLNGVINDIVVDLIALPQGVDLGQYV